MDVAVLFSLRVAAGTTIGEGDLLAAMKAAPEKFASGYLPGQIVMLVPRQPVAFIEDEDLTFPVQQLLEGLPELAAGRPLRVGFSEAPGAIHFTPAGERLRISAEYFRTSEAPLDAILPALLACCERFLAFGRAGFADGSPVRHSIAALEPWLAAAHRALRSRAE